MPDHIAQTARQEWLELLYLADGRDSPDHPHYQLFTGLWQQHLDQQGASSPPPTTPHDPS